MVQDKHQNGCSWWWTRCFELDSLQDVDNDVANATNNQIIKYNSTSGKWERSSDYVIQETSHADVVVDGDFTSEGLLREVLLLAHIVLSPIILVIGTLHLVGAIQPLDT